MARSRRLGTKPAFLKRQSQGGHQNPGGAKTRTSNFYWQYAKSCGSIRREHRQHPRVPIHLLVSNFASSEEPHQRDVAQGALDDLQLGAGGAKVRAAAPSSAHVNRARNALAGDADLVQ